MEQVEGTFKEAYTVDEFFARADDKFRSTIPGYQGIEEKDPIDSEFIQTLISADEIFRGKHGKSAGWPLLNESEIHALMLEYGDREFKTEMPIVVGVASRDPHYSRKYHQIPAMYMCRADLMDYFGATDYILSLGRGKLVAAGGAIFQALTHGYSRSRGKAGDIDLFFIGFDATPEGEQEAGELLEEIIENLAIKYEQSNNLRGRLNISRNQNVTTVLYDNMNYQFVHRPYPKTGTLLGDISMPIGGFDLFSCAVAYYLDPEDYEADKFKGKFYATPCGAFALATMTNILMTSRNSTSMVYRLKKYASRGVDILFPGTSREKMSKHSLQAKMAYHRDMKSMPIKLPHITFRNGFNANMVDVGDVSDYESQATVNAHLSIGTVTIANIYALLSGKLEQYSAYSKSWSGIYDSIKPILFKYPGKLTRIASNLLKNALRELVVAHGRLLADASFYKFATNFSNIYRQYLQSLPDFDHDYESMVESLAWGLPKALMEFNKRHVDGLTQFLEVQEQRAIAILQSKHHMNSTNPLRQHTASHNPVIMNPREWWGPDNYVPFVVGFPANIFVDLYWLFSRGQYSYIGPSGFKSVLLPYFARAWAEGAVETLVSKAMANYSSNLQSHYLMRVAYSLKCNRSAPKNENEDENEEEDEDENEDEIDCFSCSQPYIDNATKTDSSAIRPIKIIADPVEEPTPKKAGLRYLQLTVRRPVALPRLPVEEEPEEEESGSNSEEEVSE